MLNPQQTFFQSQVSPLRLASACPPRLCLFLVLTSAVSVASSPGLDSVQEAALFTYPRGAAPPQSAFYHESQPPETPELRTTGPSLGVRPGLHRQNPRPRGVPGGRDAPSASTEGGPGSQEPAAPRDGVTTHRAVLDGLLYGLTAPQLPFHSPPGNGNGEGILLSRRAGVRFDSRLLLFDPLLSIPLGLFPYAHH